MPRKIYLDARTEVNGKETLLKFDNSIDLYKYIQEVVESTTAKTQNLVGAGAVSLESNFTLLTTTGANALTLAAGREGQEKFIKMLTDGGDGTLTVTNLQGGTTLTFNDAGDFVHLLYLGNKWNILTNSGVTLA